MFAGGDCMSAAESKSATVVNTAKVAGRRILHFDSIDQAIAEVQRLAELDRVGKLKQLGNWTFGQAVGHLATWTEYAFTGAPLKPPFFIRWILKFQKQKFLKGPMPVGVKIPGVNGGTLGTERLPLGETLPRFVKAMERLEREKPILPSPALGKLTHEEHIKLNLRHTELHLSFFVPTEAP